MKIEKISKEQIKEFKQVPSDDSLTSLKPNLNTALKLGNTFKSKCKLVFNTTAGKKKVCSTIWDVTDEHVALKGGNLLISSIVDIKLI